MNAKRWSIWVMVTALVPPGTALAADIICPGHWDQVASDGPPGRNRHSMAYDEQRERVVLFGGYQDLTGERLGDTWEWNGKRWKQTASKGPTARTHTAMAYDAERQRVTLFGGVGTRRDMYQDNDDTWTWDGSHWTLVAEGGPPARNAHGMAYDWARQRVVMYGGGITFVGTVFDDTWEWDGTQWRERHRGSNPGPRAVTSSIAYDRERGNTVLYGDGSHCGFRDTWIWDGRAWAQADAAGPTPKASAALAYDSARHRTVMFGGDDCSNFEEGGDTWEWDGHSWLRVATTGPGPRGGATAMAYDHHHGRVVLFGGAGPGNPDMGDTWAWSGPVYACENDLAGDLNCDGMVDFDDRKIIRSAQDSASCSALDPRDVDHDGQITRADVDQLTGMCTLPGCQR